MPAQYVFPGVCELPLSFSELVPFVAIIGGNKQELQEIILTIHFKKYNTTQTRALI